MASSNRPFFNAKYGPLAAIITFVIPSFPTAAAQVNAKRAIDFLNTIGVCTHIAQGIDNSLSRVISGLRYAGIRNLRDDGSTNPRVIQSWLIIHAATGAKLTMLPINGDIRGTLATYERLASEGALLAAEGPNEPNNFPVTYNGKTSGYATTFRPVAEFQRDLYAAIKSDYKLAGIPVFASSEAGGAEPDNVGLQFLTIPPNSGTEMPAGTTYADYANTHNYVLGNGMSRLIDNTAWGAEAPAAPVGSWDGPYGEYGITWHRGFKGYPVSQLSTLPKVTTETGWPTAGKNAIDQDQQGKLLINVYLDAFKLGWSYTFVYMLRDDPVQGYWGFFNVDYTPKRSAVYLHNLTTILQDDSSTFALGTLDYSIPNQPTAVHDMLMQKSDGTYLLAVWGEKTAGQDVATVKFGNTERIAKIFDPTKGSAAIESHFDVDSITLTLDDHVLIIELSN